MATNKRNTDATNPRDGRETGSVGCEAGTELREAVGHEPERTSETSSIDDTLAERGARYGDFKGHAKVTQNIKAAFVESSNWPYLPDSMKESLEMIAHKIGRILNGDPYYKDSWHDLIGYAKLIEDTLV